MRRKQATHRSTTDNTDLHLGPFCLGLALNGSLFPVFPARQKTSTGPGRSTPLRTCPLDRCPVYTGRPFRHDRPLGDGERRSCSLPEGLRSWPQSQGTQALSYRWNVPIGGQARNRASKMFPPPFDERCWQVRRRAFACVLPPGLRDTHLPFFVWSRLVSLRAEGARTRPSILLRL